MKYREIGIYIHIPFCKSKCHYCDFISSNENEITIQKYIEVVLMEIEEYGKVDGIRKALIKTIYIGGGTPSHIDSKYIKKIMDKLTETFNFSEEAEVTIEINPGTVDEEKVMSYKKLGFNRISIGLQETDDKLLKQLGRIHTYDEFEHTYNLCWKAGFENINVDLMIGLPNQTIANIKKSLMQIEKLNPKHVSIYSLIIEEGTKLEKQIQNNELTQVDEEIERKMYWLVKGELEQKGYIHYEISNFAKPGFESKHNADCWNQKEYIGIGLAAHSYIDNIRYNNKMQLEEYMVKYREKEENENQNELDKLKEYMLLGLRKIQGVNIEEFKEKFGKNPCLIFEEQLTFLTKESLIDKHDGKIILTKKGIDLANQVWAEFI